MNARIVCEHCGRFVQEDRTQPGRWLHWPTALEECGDQIEGGAL